MVHSGVVVVLAATVEQGELAVRSDPELAGARVLTPRSRGYDGLRVRRIVTLPGVEDVPGFRRVFYKLDASRRKLEYFQRE